DRVLAFAVLPGSPAANAGLKEEDVVESIDGKPALEWTPDTIAETIDRGKPGSRHTLVVVREGKRHHLTLVLKDLL
ncbi:MAG TPA: PDZ domain-containing protein, partial [Candidatus Eisenbacteria bacterium]